MTNRDKLLGVVDLDKAVRYIEFLKEAQGNEVEA